MKDKRTFLQWFVITIAYVVAAFFTYQFDLFQQVWHADFTMMTSVIAVIFVSSLLYIGYASWSYDSNQTNIAYARVGVGRVTAYIVTLFGLLGTAIGLMVQVRTMGHIDVSNPANILQFITAISSALSTALFATATGITASILLTIVNTNLEYFADKDDKSDFLKLLEENQDLKAIINSGMSAPSQVVNDPS